MAPRRGRVEEDAGADPTAAVPAGDGAGGSPIPPAITPIVTAAGTHVPEVLAQIEDALRRAGAPGEQPIDLAALDPIAAGGKRLRPLLTVIAAGPAVADPTSTVRAAVIRAGVAVELIHTATLLHDDILDAGQTRRGRPTAFARHGRSAATCLGDLLFAAAFSTLAEGDDAAALRVLAEASRDLARGELLQRADAWSTEITEDRYLRRCQLKTGALFQAAAALGALAAGEDPASFARFSAAIGVAFQLYDDVLDVIAPPEQTGKPRGSDLLDGTVTLPLLVARVRDPSLAALDRDSIVTPEAAAEICDRISATGAPEVTEARARQLVDTGLASLPPDLDPARRRALELVARGVVDRRL